MLRRNKLAQPSVRLSLERLEDRLAAGSLLPFLPYLAPPPPQHLYSSAQEYSSGTDVAPYQLVSRQGGQEPEDDPVGQNEAIARSNAFFAALASRPDLLDESSRFLDKAHDPFARAQDDEQQHPISADESDPPIPHGGNNAPNIPNATSNNDANPKNLAGANPNAGASQGAGAGQGPGGISTPNPSGGGGGGGGGGGTPAGGNLATLANEGAFANPSLGNTAGHGATMTPQVQTNASIKPLTPGGDPPIAFTEGMINSPVIVATFADADGNTDPSQYTASINWGNGQITTGGVMYNSSNGQFEVAGGMTYAEEGNYPITVTINDSDGNQTTATATAAVADAALTAGYSSPISATAGQLFNGPFGEFSDANTNAPASDFTVSVNWGDGTPSSAGTVTPSGGSGGFVIGGSHTYTTAGTYDVNATITDVGGSQTTVSTTANVASGLTPGSSAMVSFVEGNSATVQVATFTDGDGNTNPSNYTAGINWGNGQTTAGTVEYNSSSSQFQVYGTMTYADEGNYPIGVTINDSDGSSTTATASAYVGDAALTAGTTGPLSLTVGQVFNGTVASFNDANTNASASDFTASIAWGDGNTSTGTVTAQGNGAFVVGGSHTYATAGTYPIDVTITDVGGSQTSASTSANVSAGSPTGLTPGSSTNVPFVEGASASVQVATFTDSDNNTDPSQYSANINWGNGQTSSGTVSYNSSTGQFQVNGTMTYADEGNYPISVTITDTDGATTTATANAIVGDAALTAGYNYPISATSGQLFSGSVASFNDANINAPASDFTASITWGDGTPSSPGTVTSQGNGTFQVTGDHTYATAGSDPITVSISDDGGSQTTVNTSATVTGGSSSAPVANNDSYSLSHDTTFSVDAASGVLDNDTDPNGLPLSAVLVSGPSDGTVNLNSNGSFTYTPYPGWAGSDSFSYYATDGQQNSNTATVTLKVSDGGTLSTQADSYSILHDQVLSVDASTGVLANDSDSDGDGLTASLATGPSHGTLQFNNDGSFTYTATAGYVGSDSFSYTASDGVSTSAPTTVSISVTNTAPTAVNQTYGIPENTTENVTAASGLLNGAGDADGDSLTASAVTQPSDGTVVVNSDGSFIYTPNTGYTGSDSFTYAVSDGAASTDATVMLNVHADSSSPTANAASYSIQHDQILTETAAHGVLAYASDSDGDPLTATLISGPSNGTVTLNPDGSFTYTPNAGYTGSDSFQYAASDGATTSAPATVTIGVTNTGLPVANPDNYSVASNTQLVTVAFDTAQAYPGVLANDSDADGDQLTASLASGPSYGTLQLNSDGTFTYTPNSGFTGTDSFTYTASDGIGTSSPATVTINVIAPPSAVNDSYQVQRDQTLNVNSSTGVLANDTDANGDSLTANLVGDVSNGTLALDSDGSFTYTPNPGFVGTDSFTYTANDDLIVSNTATVTLTVAGPDVAPVANAANYSVVHDRVLTTTPMTGVLAYASDADGNPLTASLVSGPSNGTLQLNSDGSFTYTPNPGYVGSDSFQYQVSDGQLSSNTATVSLSVTNQAPTALDDGYQVAPNTPFTATAATGVLANDSDPDGDTLTASVVSQPSYGTLDFHSDGSFTYTPNTGYTGPDSFTYEANDGVGDSNVATVYFNAANTPPKFSSPTYTFTIPENAPNTNTVGITPATDPDGDALTYSITAGNTSSAFAINADTGAITVADSTQLSYLTTPQYTLTVQVSDGTQTDTATVTINLKPATGVKARNDGYSTTPGTKLTVSAANGVLANDYSLQGRPIDVTEYKKPANGTLDINADGSFTYTPNPSFKGTDSFQYWVSDGTSTANAIVTIVVSAPVLEGAADAYYMDSNSQKLVVTCASIGGLLSNDASNGTWQTYTLVSYTAPKYEDPGTPFQIHADGTFVYTPMANWSGYDSFTYQFRDAQGNLSQPVDVEIFRNGNTLTSSIPDTGKDNGGLVLAGGGSDSDNAMKFLINQAKGGNFVVLTYSSATAGPKSYASYIWDKPTDKPPGLDGLDQLHSLELIAIRAPWDANNPAYIAAIKNANAIFITGGNQANYVNLWPTGGIRDAVNQAITNGAAIGGTSAGLAILGQVAYAARVQDPTDGRLTSQESLQNPASKEIDLTKDFLQIPQLQNVVTETHVQPEDKDPQGRMGRLIAFLANMAVNNPGVSGTPRGIAVSGGNAVRVNPDGSATVVGKPDGFAYFVTVPNTVPVVAAFKPLNWNNIEVIRVSVGVNFNLKTWASGGGIPGGRRYLIDVINGLLAVEGNNDIY